MRARIACIFKRESVAFGQQKRVVVSNERDDSTMETRFDDERSNTFKIRLETLASSVPVTDANVATFSAFSSSFLRPRAIVVVVVVRPVVVVRRASDDGVVDDDDDDDNDDDDDDDDERTTQISKGHFCLSFLGFHTSLNNRVFSFCPLLRKRRGVDR